MLRVKMVNLKRRKIERERGVTLVELMLVVGIMGIVLAAMYNMFNFQQKSYTVQDNVAIMQQNVRVGIEYMVKEIRMTGYIPEDIPYDPADPPDVIPVSGSRDDDEEVTGASFSDGVDEAIEEATADSIAIQADVDDDGASEVVRYVCTYDAGESTTYLTRQTWKWNGAAWDDDLDGDGSADGPQIIAEDIDTIAFSYALLADDDGLDNDIDDDGDGEADDDGELRGWNLGVDGLLNTNDLRSYIRQVTVALAVRTPTPDSSYTHPDEGDHYRRKTLTSRIGLRNMK